MSTTTEITPRTWPGVRAWGALVAAETRMVARDTAGLVVPIGLPLLVLVMNGLGQAREEIPGLGGLRAFEVYVLPLVTAVVLGTIGVVNMPSFLAYYRRTGVLRRLAVTPARPLMVLVAQVTVSALQAVLGIGLALGVAVVAFDLQAPRSPAVAVLVTLLGAAALYAVGLLVAAVAPSGNAAVALGLTLFFVMGATGGLFGPTQALPPAVGRVGELLPFGATVDLLGAAWVGQAVAGQQVAALVVATVVCAGVAARWFRWE